MQIFRSHFCFSWISISLLFPSKWCYQICLFLLFQFFRAFFPFFPSFFLHFLPALFGAIPSPRRNTILSLARIRRFVIYSAGIDCCVSVELMFADWRLLLLLFLLMFFIAFFAPLPANTQKSIAKHLSLSTNSTIVVVIVHFVCKELPEESGERDEEREREK